MPKMKISSVLIILFLGIAIGYSQPKVDSPRADNLSANISAIELNSLANNEIESSDIQSTPKSQSMSDIEKKDNIPESANQSNIFQTKNDLQQADRPQTDLYKVIKVVDGDTIAVDIAGKTETIRLIGVNTPETVDSRKIVECFSKEASNKAKEVLSGKSVKLEADSTQGERDKYGRLLRYVFLEDGTDFNKMMIGEGYAYEYTYNVPYKYQTEFKQAEKEAREGRRGLWAPDTCNTQTIPIPTPTANQTPVVGSTPAPMFNQYNCSGNIYNCSDFSTHNEAQAAYKICGGVANDIHRLDADKDGLVCETLP